MAHLRLTSGITLKELENFLVEDDPPATDAEMLLAARLGAGSSSMSVRDDAAQWLGTVGTARDLFLIKRLCADPEWAVRCSAVSALASVGRRRQATTIKKLLAKERHPVVRKYAMVALFDAVGPEILPYIQELEPHETEEQALLGVWSVYAECGIELTDEQKALFLDWKVSEPPFDVEEYERAVAEKSRAESEQP